MSVSAETYNQTLYDFQRCLDEKNRYLEALEKVFDTASGNGEDVSYLIAKNAIQPGSRPRRGGVVMAEKLEKIELEGGGHIPLYSVYDQYCFKHEGNFLKDYCLSCFRDKLLFPAADGQNNAKS